MHPESREKISEAGPADGVDMRTLCSAQSLARAAVASGGGRGGRRHPRLLVDGAATLNSPPNIVYSYSLLCSFKFRNLIASYATHKISVEL